MTAGAQVGARVRGLMAQQQRTAAEVADALGISTPAVYRRLSGEVPLNVDELELLAALFEVPIAELAGSAR